MRVAVPLFVFVACMVGSPAARADDWLGRDKALHFAASAGIAAGAYGGSALFLEPRWGRATIAATVTVAVGAGKELRDLAGYGDPSWKDFAWDLIGTAVGVGVSLLVDYALRGPRPYAEPTAAGAGADAQLRW